MAWRRTATPSSRRRISRRRREVNAMIRLDRRLQVSVTGVTPLVRGRVFQQHTSCGGRLGVLVCPYASFALPNFCSALTLVSCNKGPVSGRWLVQEPRGTLHAGGVCLVRALPPSSGAEQRNWTNGGQGQSEPAEGPRGAHGCRDAPVTSAARRGRYSSKTLPSDEQDSGVAAA